MGEASTLLFHIASYAPSQVAYFIAALVLFDIEKKGRFALLFVLCCVAWLPVSYLDLAAAKMIAGLLLMVGPQVLFSSDRPLRKAFLAAIFVAVIMLSEILPMLLWVQVTSYDPTSAQAYLYYFNEIVVLRALNVLAIIGMFAGVVFADRHISKVRSDEGILICAGFLVAQCVLLCLVVLGLDTLGHIPSDLASFLLLAFALCLIADAVLFVLMLRFNETLLVNQRAEMLKLEVDQCLERYQEIKVLVTQIAHLRHDFANHTNTALMLVRQGELERARLCLEDLAEYVRHEKDEGIDLSKIDSFAMEAKDSRVPEAEVGELEPMRLKDVRLWLTASRVVLVFSQVLLLFVLLAFMVMFGVTPQYAISILGAVIMCVVSDLVLMGGLRQVSRRNLLLDRSRYLEEQSAAWALQNKRMAAELEQAGRVRAGMVKEIEMLDGMLARGEGAAVLSALEGRVRLRPSASSSYCEHEVANAIISLKAHVCEGYDIEFTHDVFIPSDVAISDVELCAVLSNILDNSINACLQVEGERRISLKTKYAAGMLVVVTENTWDGGDLKRKDRGLSMMNKHGWGLEILEGLAQRHNGSFEAAPLEGNIFRASVMLSAPRM
ncbi:MAG: sensor histidine kinase [Eggerthellaceae bacterium]|nr:sensor histidine kinase [Eggerthellaceae bacterium]